MKTQQTLFDAVLIDDDPLIREVWKLSAMDNAKNIRVYSSAQEFFDSLDDFCRNTEIYIDSRLGEKVSGEVIAQKIYEYGFQNIYLATGFSPQDIKPNPYLKGIQGKIPPWEINTDNCL